MREATPHKHLTPKKKTNGGPLVHALPLACQLEGLNLPNNIPCATERGSVSLPKVVLCSLRVLSSYIALHHTAYLGKSCISSVYVAWCNIGVALSNSILHKAAFWTKCSIMAAPNYIKAENVEKCSINAPQFLESILGPN